MDSVDQECKKSKAGVACIHPTTLDAQQDLLRCPHLGFRPRWFKSCGLEHIGWVQISYNMLLGVPKNGHSKRTKENLHSLLWPTLEIRFIPLWPQTFLRSQVNTYPDSIWDAGRVKVNKLLDTSPKLLDRIIESGNKKAEKHRKRLDRGSGKPHRNSFALLQQIIISVFNSISPSARQNWELQGGAHTINYTQPFLTQNNCNLSNLVLNLHAVQKHKAKKKV